MPVPTTNVVELPKRAVKYDPYYDPPPGMVGDAPPPRDVAKDTIIAKAGQACVCNQCNAVVYTINKDIRDNCKVADFIGSFTPFTSGVAALARTAEIQNIEGNISTDCVLCGGTGKPISKS